MKTSILLQKTGKNGSPNDLIPVRNRRRPVVWLKYGLVVFLVLLLGIALFFDSILKLVLEGVISSETGLKTTIGKVHVGFRKPVISIENIKILNREEFGSGPMLDVPEIYLEYKHGLLRSNSVGFAVMRIHIGTLNVVETSDGRINVDDFQKEQEKKQKKSKKKGSEKDDFVFGGIDHLQVTLGRTTFTSQRRPNQNKEVDFGIRNKVFTRIKDEKDLQTIVLALVLEGGASFLLGPNFIGPGLMPAKSNSAGTNGSGKIISE